MEKISKTQPSEGPHQSPGSTSGNKKNIIHHRASIILKQRIVLFIDECHLLWGDSLGYVWGKQSERVEVSMEYEKERQTYFGGVNLFTGNSFVLPASAGNGEETLHFLKALRQGFQGRPLTIIWDGAPYHRARIIKNYLLQINANLPEEHWPIHLIQFAPNAPE